MRVQISPAAPIVEKNRIIGYHRNMDPQTKNTHSVLNIFHRIITIGLFSTAVLVSTIIVTSTINSTQTIEKKAAQNCPFISTAKVLRADGKPLDGTEKVGSIDLGIINDKNSKARKADQVLNFNGTLTFKTQSFTFSPYKRGDNAYIYLTNLNTDRWQVTRVFCNQLGGSQVGCDRSPSLVPPEPLVDAHSITDSYSWTDPQIGPIHLECGVNIEYGWIIEPLTSEPPQAPQEESKSSIPYLFILNDLAGYASIDGSTTGGFAPNTSIRVVTNFADKGPNSLRELVTGNEPKIIIFEKDADIKLKSQVFIGANTSILALDKKVQIRGRGIRIVDSSNVIISGLKFVEGLQDALEIRNSHHVWIDRIHAQKFSDGLIDIVGGTKTRKDGTKIKGTSHHITVSRSRLNSHEKVMLIGNDEIDTQVDKITLWGNHFANFGHRSPRVRYSTVDMYNNVIENWSNSGIRSTLGATINAENNIFIFGGPDKLLKRFAENFLNKPGQEPGNIILKGNFSTNDKLQRIINTSQLTNPKASFTRPYPAYPKTMQKPSTLPYPANRAMYDGITTVAGVNQ